MKRPLYLLLLMCLPLWLLLGVGAASAQIVAVNDGAVIRVEGGLVVSVQGGFLNQNGGIIYNSDTIHIAAEIENHAPNGMFENGTYPAGAVVMDNTNGVVTPVAEQNIQGTQPIYFQTLRLRGTNAKALVGVNAYVRNELELRDREFDLHTNDLRVVTPNVNAITRSSGFITMDQSSLGGHLLRYTNSTGNYGFPVGVPTFTIPARPAYVTPSAAVLDSFEVRFGAYDATTNTPSYDRAVINPATICEVNELYFHTIERAAGSGQVSNVGLTLFYDPAVATENLFTGLGGWIDNPAAPPAIWWDVIGQTTSPITEPGLNNFSTPSINLTGIVNEGLAFVVPKPPASFDPISTPICSNAGPDTIFNATPAGGTFEFFNISAGLPGVLVYSGPDSIVDPVTLGPGTFLLTYFATVTTPSGTCNTEPATQTIVINAAPDITGDNTVCADTDDEPYTNAAGINGAWTISTTIGSTASGNVNGLVDFGSLTGAPVTDSLFYTDINGCRDTFNILVNPTPVITSGPDEVCADAQGVAYTGSTGTGNGLTWSFNPASTIGSTINAGTGIANYGGTNVSIVETIVLADAGTSCFAELDVDVRPRPDGGFTAADNVICANDPVVLTADQGTGANFTHVWVVTDAGGADVTATALNNAGTTPVTFNPAPNPPSLPAGVYTIDLTVDQTYPSGLVCSDATTGTITVNPMPDFTIDVAPTSVCPGFPVVFTVNDQAVPAQTYTYLWTSAGLPNGIGQSYTIDPATLPSPETVSVQVTNQFGCVLDSTTSATVSPKPLLTFAAFPSPLCTGANSPITVNVSPGLVTDYTYNWTLDGTPVANTLNTADINTSGTVQVIAINNTTGCEDTISADIDFIEEAQITVTSNVPGNEVCDGDSIVFTATVTSGDVSDLAFNWTLTNPDGTTTPIVGTPTATGSTITVFAGIAVDLDVTSATCPNFTFTYLTPISFTVLPKPIVTYVPMPDSLYFNERGQFIASYIAPAPVPGVTFNYSYVWDFDEDQNADLIEADSIADWQFDEVVTPGWRPVTLTLVSFPGGCRSSVLDSVYLRPRIGVDVPSAFVPGSQLGNSHLEVWAPGIDPSTFKMVIYDRWGIVVAEMDGDILNQRQKGWDGTKDGTPVPEGVYVWAIEACGYTTPDGRCHEFRETGTVTVLR